MWGQVKGLLRCAVERLAACAARLRRVRLTPRRLRKWRHWHQFTINVLIGLVIELLLEMMSSGGLVTTVKNAVQDTAMNVAAYSRSANTVSSPPITIFDVDEESWRHPSWGGGEPDLAPRTLLARLMDIARQGDARFIVVDILIESPGTAQDAAFVGEMAKLEQELRPEQHVLFVRTLRLPDCALPGAMGLPEGSNASATEPCSDEDSAPTLRPSPLDRLIDGSGGKFIDVAPYFLSSSDGVLRAWSLWKAACEAPEPGSGATARWRLLPSIQLAIVALNGVRTDGSTIANLAQASFGACPPTLKDSAGGAPSAAGTVPRKQVEGRMARELAAGMTANFTAGLAEAEDSASPRHIALDPSSVIYFRFPSGTGSLAANGNGIQTLSALQLLGGKSPGSLANQTVIISQSHESARDWHLTPLGRMTGGMVIANSINSLQDPGVIAHPHPALELLFAIVSIGLVAWLFAVVRAEFSLLLAIGFVPILLLLTYWMLNFGLLLGSEVALVGIYLHWIFRTVETALKASEAHRDRGTQAPADNGQGTTG